jgi:hypothetical protein
MLTPFRRGLGGRISFQVNAKRRANPPSRLLSQHGMANHELCGHAPRFWSLDSGGQSSQWSSGDICGRNEVKATLRP